MHHRLCGGRRFGAPPVVIPRLPDGGGPQLCNHQSNSIVEQCKTNPFETHGSSKQAVVAMRCSRAAGTNDRATERPARIGLGPAARQCSYISCIDSCHYLPPGDSTCQLSSDVSPSWWWALLLGPSSELGGCPRNMATQPCRAATWAMRQAHTTASSGPPPPMGLPFAQLHPPWRGDGSFGTRNGSSWV